MFSHFPMERLLALACLLAVLGTGPSPALAQSEEGLERAAPAQPAPPPAGKPRTVSSATAAMLAASMPKFDPPKPAPKPEPVKEVDLRDIDKPKNGIIRLPKYVVHGEKPPIFREEDLYTKRGLTGLAMHRYAGLNIGPLSGLNAPIALEMYREDERLQSMSDLAETAHAMSRGGDDPEGQYILRQTQDTYGHQMDFGGAIPGQPNPPK